MGYFFLVLVIASEVAATTPLKSTEGFARLWPTSACLGGYAVSFLFLSQAVKVVPVGVAYALWSGLGTVAIVPIGTVFPGEALSLAQGAGVGLIVAGVVIHNVGGTH